MDRQRRSGFRGSFADVEASEFSQNGEDGILRSILEQVGIEQGTFVEIGAADGEQNCTRALAERGWRGTWIEGDPELAAHARGLDLGGRVAVVAAMVDAENVVSLLDETHTKDPDVVVVDIDGNDYYVLRSLLARYRPTVVVVEYNGSHRWPWVAQYEPRREWDRSWDFGASLRALADLLKSKDYDLVGCDAMGVNAFFVRSDRRPATLRTGSVAQLEVIPAHRPGTIGHPRSSPLGPPTPDLASAELSAISLERAEVVGSCRRRPAERFNVVVDVHNRTDRLLTSSGAHPVYLTYLLLCLDLPGAVSGDPLRAPLASSVAPGETRPSAIEVELPGTPGRYLVIPTVVQEFVAWRTAVPGEGVEVTSHADSAPGLTA